jgi:hypothetical protein
MNVGNQPIEPGAPGPILQSTLAACNWLVRVLLHFDGDGLAGCDEGVVLRGACHGDLVRPTA